MWTQKSHQVPTNLRVAISPNHLSNAKLLTASDILYEWTASVKQKFMTFCGPLKEKGEAHKKSFYF